MKCRFKAKKSYTIDWIISHMNLVGNQNLSCQDPYQSCCNYQGLEMLLIQHTKGWKCCWSRCTLFIITVTLVSLLLSIPTHSGKNTIYTCRLYCPELQDSALFVILCGMATADRSLSWEHRHCTESNSPRRENLLLSTFWHRDGFLVSTSINSIWNGKR